VFLAWERPGQPITRHVIAMAQIMFSSLLIQVSGGRIETHFHVFGSLAFLAFYRDWRLLVAPTIFVAIDHYVRGAFWPGTVFGIETPDPWRWVEHAAWVIYEDIFLFISCRYGAGEMWSSAIRTAKLERVNREMQEQTVELQRSYQAQNAIVESALDAVISMDQEGRITGWNPQAEATFGWSESEVLGKPLAETIIPSRFRELHLRGLANYHESGEHQVLNRRIEVSALHRDGREFAVELAIAPIHSHESVTFCGFIRDITLRIQAAEAMRSAKEAAEASSNAKSAFLANMSHEIRTPLNGILGFADVLLNQIDGDEKERRDYLHVIHDSGRHLLDLINDVLDLSKIESGQMEVERVHCSPHEIIASTISILRVRAAERGLSLDYFWKSEIPETIHTDPARLRQILMNLIANAIKFTEVGSVQVAARIRTAAEGPQLVVDVIDTGVGIPADSIERIFEPFVQADTSITRRFGGTGLGLSISRRIARLLDGELTVNSEPGRGSIFSVSVSTGSLDGVRWQQGSVSDLIRNRNPDEATKSRRVLPPSRILLVEDGVTNRNLMKVVLGNAGATVRCAENGQVGVDAAGEESFDLILMDMQMPVMDGYSATREMRRMGLKTPIIALTAHAMAGDERKCRDAGCSGYLTKPIEPRRLLDAVCEVLIAQQELAQRNSTDDETPIVSRLLTDSSGDFREIVDEVIVKLEEKIAAIHEAWKVSDFEKLAELGHWIKGSAGTAGFDAFTAPASRLERLAKSNSPNGMSEVIYELDKLLRRIQPPVSNSV